MLTTPPNRALQAAALAAYMLVVLQNTWLHEDAFITFRTVDNLLNGYGAVWNVGERVQTYTHPLWFGLMALAHWLSGEVFYTSMVVSWLCSLGAAVLVVAVLASSVWTVALGTALLCLCKAFVDYSTSGLENPLSHLLLALFVAVFLRADRGPRRLVVLGLLTALAALTRMDSLVIYGPPLLYCLWQERSARALYLLLCGLPLFLGWELFSLVYYGFFVPNTAYAKLNTGVAFWELAHQGVRYLHNSLRVDPLALVALGATSAWCAYRRSVREGVILLGCALYLVYVVRIGGDYMTGRFIALPFLGAVCVLVHAVPLRDARAGLTAIGVVLAVGLSAAAPPPLSGVDYEEQGVEPMHGILDERANYHAATGLLKALYADEDVHFPRHHWVDFGRQLRAGAEHQELVVTTYYNIGILPYYAGPKLYHADVLGIGTALLARLPAFADADWSPGHFERIMPEGYIETLIYGENVLADRRLGRYYDGLRLITSGPIFSGARWRAIWEYHRGAWDPWLNWEAYRAVSPEDIDRSRARLEPRVRLRPSPFERNIALGDIYFTSRAFGPAVRAYGRAVDALEDGVHDGEQMRYAYMQWAMSLYAAGDRDEALRAILRFAPSNFGTDAAQRLLERALQDAFNDRG